METVNIKHYPHDFLVNRLILWAIPEWIKPNQITALRFILIPPVVWLVYSGHYAWATALFIIAALTDAVDGSLARTRRQITEWGELFDPVADKLLIGTVGLILIYRFLHLFLIVIILVLEFLVIFATFYLKKKNPQIRPKANVFGKIKMVLQVVGVTLLLIFAQFPGSHILSGIISLIFIISIFFTLLSMYYFGI
jgi:CDP-diacylglycerol--glycerol-3-phosphate 3-phosphatidyltransferase